MPFKGWIINILDTTEEGFSDIEERQNTNTLINLCVCRLQHNICISDPEIIQKYTENKVCLC